MPDNAVELFEQYDLILDGTDNFETRFLINDYAVSRGKPWIYGAAVGSYQVTATAGTAPAGQAAAGEIAPNSSTTVSSSGKRGRKG